MAASGDPVGTGVVSSLARPGGNVTGLSSIVAELAGKRLELLKEAFPSLSRVAVLWNPTNPAAVNDWKAADVAARSLGLSPLSLEVRTAHDFRSAFDATRRHNADVLIVVLDALIQHHQQDIVELAMRHRLPTVFASREFVEAGGLMSYGVNYPGLDRRAAFYIDKILKGAKPAELPIEQPTTFDLAVNLKTAKALGLTIPQSVLLRADEVIQ